MISPGKQAQKDAFQRRKELPGPIPTLLLPAPRKHPTKLHKKYMKLEGLFNAAEGKPLDQARLLKMGVSVERKLEKLKEVKA